MKTELLAPAGSMEALDAALYFGADAVYLSGARYGLRAHADNFGGDALHEAAERIKKKRKKMYVAVNAFFHESDFTGLAPYLREVHAAGADALIVSDPGVLHVIRETLPDMPVHLSTQQNTLNVRAARFWHDAGVRRVILARECTIENIRCIREGAPDTLELEAFVHGALCMAYSGRCLLSAFLAGRSANAGACAQPCRWEYTLKPADGGEGMPILEDERGAYILNSRDLNMIAHLDKLYGAGVRCFKIEGRMRSAYYVATTVKAYRRALDGMLRGEPFDPAWARELEKAGTRSFTTGFYFGNPMEEGQQYDSSQRPMPYAFVARVLGRDAATGLLRVEQRNRFFVGDTLEILSPHTEGSLTVRRIVADGRERESAPHPQEICHIDCGVALQEGDMLRKRL